MSGLRLEIDLGRIAANARLLVSRCGVRHISVTAVTKAMLGDPALARSLTGVGELGSVVGGAGLGGTAGLGGIAGVAQLGDSRIENIERLRGAGLDGPMLLVRSPSPSQIGRVVAAGVTSVNTEPAVLAALSAAARAAGRVHDVMLMVELGDLREGVMPDRVHDVVRHIVGLAGVRLQGIGANLACRNGIEPSNENMGALSAIVDSVEAAFGIGVPVVSGGNSANLAWALGPNDVGRVNNLRLGESILLGREPLHRQAIAGLHTDGFVLVAEVIECQRKPSRPWGTAGQSSFGEPAEVADRGEVWQTILAVGRQDTDPADLVAPAGVAILAASSDHLVTATVQRTVPGDEIRFEPGYSALLRSMTSPFVAKCLTNNEVGQTFSAAG